MTNDKALAGLPSLPKNTTKIKDPVTGLDRVLVEEIYDYDDDGNIKGVFRIWQ